MAKTKKIRLDCNDCEPINIGLIRLKHPIPAHLFFFKINRYTAFPFYRIENFMTRNAAIEYEFLCMQAQDEKSENIYQIIANKSFVKRNNTALNLFEGVADQSYLLEDYQDVDFLIKTKDSYPDFSLILLPENAIFPIQEYQIQPNELIYQYIQENE
ncbi:IPExxxVDY family protein [Elizabethkingia argentiflava]|uniref:IPExxxVDY family protein n=1 Tax=Elizabethkingia argenteiflava TaxID=2681556 RepID=A0A845PU07_9FLAO|nr:IPExxxVDY family protein [Elizabethkingia argenteiflava]NAW51304.1 IPExxxVDY family protein [Elizabethkingia argenteiflava]